MVVRERNWECTIAFQPFGSELVLPLVLPKVATSDDADGSTVRLYGCAERNWKQMSFPPPIHSHSQIELAITQRRVTTLCYVQLYLYLYE